MAQGGGGAAAPQAVGGAGLNPNFEGKTVFLPKSCTLFDLGFRPKDHQTYPQYGNMGCGVFKRGVQF